MYLDACSAALRHVKSRDVLVINDNMPFVWRKLLEFQFANSMKAEAIVPLWYDEARHPLHTVYNKDALSQAVRQAKALGKITLGEALDRLKVHHITQPEVARYSPNGLTFFQAYTSADVRLARKLLDLTGYERHRAKQV